jgi:hypothetical protein
MAAGKVQVVRSSPDMWGASFPPADGHFVPSHDLQGQRELQRGEIWFDPLHAELIGGDVELLGDDTPAEYREKLRAMAISGADNPTVDPNMTFVSSDERYIDWKELVGDEEEEPPNDGEPGPGEPPPEQMGPDSDAPGESPAPSFSTPTGPTGPAGTAGGPAYGGMHPTIARFQANIRARNPAALRALLALQRKAGDNPKANAAFLAVASPWMGGKMAIKGEPLVVGSIAHLIKTVLSPVAWGVHGVGTVSHEVGKTLTKLASKL